MPARHPWRPHIDDEHVFNPFVSPSNPPSEEEEWFDEVDETPDIDKVQTQKDRTVIHPAEKKGSAE